MLFTYFIAISPSFFLHYALNILLLLNVRCVVMTNISITRKISAIVYFGRKFLFTEWPSWVLDKSSGLRSSGKMSLRDEYKSALRRKPKTRREWILTYKKKDGFHYIRVNTRGGRLVYHNIRSYAFSQFTRIFKEFEKSW